MLCWVRIPNSKNVGQPSLSRARPTSLIIRYLPIRESTSRCLRHGTLCREFAAWRACREKHGGFDEYEGERGTPFEWLSARFIAEYIRKYFLPDLPGGDDREKLNGLFADAQMYGRAKIDLLQARLIGGSSD